MADELTRRDYHALAEFRYHLRCFLKFSEEAARASALEPAQHQLLLAVMAMEGDKQPTVGDLARRLQLCHHSVVGLLDRLEDRGMVRRCRGEEDRRQVHVLLTNTGTQVLHDLSIHHRAELRAEGPALVRALERVLESCGGEADAGTEAEQKV